MKFALAYSYQKLDRNTELQYSQLTQSLKHRFICRFITEAAFTFDHAV